MSGEGVTLTSGDGDVPKTRTSPSKKAESDGDVLKIGTSPSLPIDREGLKAPARVSGLESRFPLKEALYSDVRCFSCIWESSSRLYRGRISIAGELTTINLIL